MTRCASYRTRWSALVAASALMGVAAAAQAQTTPPDPQTSKSEPQTPAPAQAPAQAPAAQAPGAQAPAQATSPTDIPPGAARQLPAPPSVMVGPTRELKLADNTWFRFGAQIQAWFKVAQDKIPQPDGSTGGYANDFYCRRCRLFVTGSVVKDVTFNILFEAGNFGKADPLTGVKSYAPPNILDAYAQIKFHDFFSLSAGSILLPLTRNGTQPTTTYLSIDNANVDVTPVLQGNSTVLRDLGVMANGFFLNDHLEYKLGAFQGTRAAAITTTSTTTPPVTSISTRTAGHNIPRLVAALQYNLFDTEKGYVNGGHYYGTKKVFGVVASADYQTLGNADPPKAGTSDKDPYIGFSAATFVNYPLSGTADPKKGGDELVGLLQFGYYDGGGAPSTAGTAPTNPGTYPAVLKQTNFLAEGAYYNKDMKFSVFGKFEMRKINSDAYTAAQKAGNNVMWIATGVKYYIAPANLANIGFQYERIQFPDALNTQQAFTNNFTVQLQTLLY